MRRAIMGFSAVLILSMTGQSYGSVGISIDVFPSLAPNGYGSPNFSGYVNNAIYAIEYGLTSFGDPSLPSYYQQIPDGGKISPKQNIVTGFASWNGMANPTGAFAGEYGNRLHFGLHINGNGNKFSISQLSFVGQSSDPDNYLGFSYNAGEYEYSTNYVGIIWNDDDTKTYITSGLNTQLVDELIGRGSGSAPDAYLTDPGDTNQDKINNILNELPSSYSFTGTYKLGEDSGSATVNIVPEPTTIIIWSLLGSLGLVFAWTKRKSA